MSPPCPSLPSGERENEREMASSSSPSSDDFSVFVLASDLGIDARPFLSNQQREESQSEVVEIEEEADDWQDCSQYLYPDEDFSDLEFLQFFRLQGADRAGNRIFRVVGKYFPGNPSFWKSICAIYFVKILFFFPYRKFCAFGSFFWGEAERAQSSLFRE